MPAATAGGLDSGVPPNAEAIGFAVGAIAVQLDGTDNGPSEAALPKPADTPLPRPPSPPRPPSGPANPPAAAPSPLLAAAPAASPAAPAAWPPSKLVKAPKVLLGM